MYFSTRNKDICISSSEAILKGISSDGGLFLPYSIPKLNVTEDLLKLSYEDLAFLVLKDYFDDFSEEELKSAIKKAYSKNNFKEKIIGFSNFNNYSFLELYNGPTATFKDMALSLLPYLMEIARKKEKINKEIKVLTATSGDTGSAALANFRGSKNIKLIVLYPDNGISLTQERQMLSFTSATSRAYALKNANFDDCQTLVKEVLNVKESNYLLTSANSINIGRLLPQIVYYYASYIYLVNSNKIKLNDKINVVVPTGNFGNIFSCYLAKKMGLPIDKLICASNENSVLTDFFRTGIYDENREFKKTNSPSMDILVSSNLERLLYLATNSDKKVKHMMDELKDKKSFKIDKDELNSLNDFVSYSVNEDETLNNIKNCYYENNYLIDPHTSVAYGSYLKYKKDINDNNYTIIVSTASPFKFPETIAKALEITYLDEEDALYKVSEDTNLEIPYQVKDSLINKTPKVVITKSEYKDKVLKKEKVVIKTPATSANLGCGFDVCGIALSLYNYFEFEVSDKDELIGFKPKDTKDNLILKAYKYVFTRNNFEYIPIKINSKEINIFEARGLGSSASCIVSGVLMANHVLGDYFSKKELITICSEVEGHPDNVAPCILGDFVTSFKKDEEYTSIQYEINKNIHFILCVSDFELLTKVARGVLPTSLSYKDIVFNTSRIVNLPSALASGDLNLLKDILVDTIHTPYRISLIPDAQKIRSIASDANLPFAISGAGSSLLILSHNDEIINDLKNEKYGVSYRFIDLKVDKTGAVLKEIYYE